MVLDEEVNAEAAGARGEAEQVDLFFGAIERDDESNGFAGSCAPVPTSLDCGVVSFGPIWAEAGFGSTPEGFDGVVARGVVNVPLPEAVVLLLLLLVLVVVR